MQSIDGLTIEAHFSIREALNLINKNARGICFVTQAGRLVGVATDGDIRRFLLEHEDLDRPIQDAMMRTFTALPVGTDEHLIRQAFSSRVKMIPLLDSQGIIVDFADVQKSHRIPVLEPELSGNELAYVQDCITTKWISSQGAYVRRFEEMFEGLHPNTHALAVSSGTTALHLALVALGVGPGDEVIVPDLTFAASANAVLFCGATPVLCEIDLNTWCLDVHEAAKLITPYTKAIMAVHLYGQVCQMDDLCHLVHSSQLLLIEDCAEAIGSQWRGQPVGTFGDAAAFSFFGNKTISTGEGGMVQFRDSVIAQHAKVLRDHGMSPGKRYWHEMVGFNYRLTNLQAAIGVAQLERLTAIIHRKQLIAALYQSKLSQIEGIAHLPQNIEDVLHSSWLFTVILDEGINRDEVMRQLLHYGVDTRPVFYPMHQMPPYQSLRTSESLQCSNYIAAQGLSLPSSVTLQEDDIVYVASLLESVLEKQSCD